MKLKFNLEQWLSNELVRNIPLKESDPNQDFTPSYKKEVIAKNEEKKIFQAFLLELKNKKEKNKALIREAYVHSKPFPFPELIEAPITQHKFLEKIIINNLERIENKEIYYTLLENNKIPNYQALINSLSSDTHHKKVFISYNAHNGEDAYLNIFKHAILICPPAEIQNTFKYLTSQYEELEKIDSKEESKLKLEEIHYNFHKSLRQVDPFGNPHAEMIIWELLQLTDIPHRAIKSVIDHVEKEI